MTPRVLIVEPHEDIRTLLELSMRRLGFEPVAPGDCGPGDADAVVLEPSWAHGRTILRRLGDDVPPVVCLSIYPREAGYAPPESVAYLIKPASLGQLGDALRDACGR
ncbi:MAG TPA: hypothetical protein VEH55_07185 [Gaiellaceae bacterium]|nr:hypothetical protein [Gaiellaceae bacterium]